MTGPLWLDETDVAETVTVNAAIDALRETYLAAANGEAVAIEKALGAWDGGSLHALGAVSPKGSGLGCFKTWINTPTGASAVLELFDVRSGALLAIMQAGLLGALRTSGVCALATDRLADPCADELALIGTGRQALMQAVAIAVVRRLRRVRVWSPTPDRRAAFVGRLRAALPVEVVECAELEEATRDAPIVTTVTRAKDAILSVHDLAPHAHLNAAGSILPTHGEVGIDVFRAAALVVVDDRAAAARDSRELRESGEQGGPSAPDTRTLAELLATDVPKGGAGPTVFKPLGSGLSDLAIATAAWRARGDGQALNNRGLKAPRWTVAGAK